MRATGREKRTKIIPVIDREQKYAAHDFDHADHVSVQRLRIHVAIANRGQRLHAEKEAIKKPMPTGAAGNTVLLADCKAWRKKDLA